MADIIKNLFITAFALLLITLMIVVPIWFIKYKFTDCRKVGHTLFYCLMDL